MPMTPNDDIDDDIEDIQDVEPDIGNFIAERPLASLAIAAVVGFVLARTIF